MLQPNSTPDGSLLYFLEHRFLRDQFFIEPMSILNITFEGLMNFFKEIYKSKNCEFTYANEDFNIERFKIDNYYIMIVSFPKPQEALLCDRIYFLYNEDLQDKKIVTIERAIDEPKGFLCSWDENKQHHNYGEIASLDWDEDNKNMMIALERQIIADTFMNKGE